MSIPTVVDLRRFCEEADSVEAVFRPTQLPRLLQSVADTAGEVSMQVRGSLDARGRPSLDVRIAGVLSVLCQRCLQPMSVSLAVDQTLAFADDGVGGLSEPEAFDPEGVEVLPMTGHIDLAELVEEEVLLSLPMLPRHPACDLPVPAEPGKMSPFAALQGLAIGRDSGPHEDN